MSQISFSSAGDKEAVPGLELRIKKEFDRCLASKSSMASWYFLTCAWNSLAFHSISAQQWVAWEFCDCTESKILTSQYRSTESKTEQVVWFAAYVPVFWKPRALTIMLILELFHFVGTTFTCGVGTYFVTTTRIRCLPQGLATGKHCGHSILLLKPRILLWNSLVWTGKITIYFFLILCVLHLFHYETLRNQLASN